MKSNVKRLFAGPYILWMIGFTIIPLLLIVYYGLTTKSGAFTLANVCSITTPEHMKALLLSLGLSLAATAICLLLSYPLALVLRRRGIGAGSFMVFVFILPMWMNFLLRTLAWQTLLEKNGVINGILSFLHLPNIAIINTPWAIILGMVYNFLPFMILPIYNNLRYFQSLRRQQDPAHRKCHRAGVHQGKQLALRFRSLAGSDDFHFTEYGAHRQIR